MSLTKRILIAVSIVFTVSTVIPAAKAGGLDESNWPTVATFDEAVQIGSFVLNPGSYEFQLSPGTVDRTVMMIYSLNDRRWVGMVMGINDNRAVTSRMSGFTFSRMNYGEIKVLEYWCYPNWNRGIKFLSTPAVTDFAMTSAIVSSAR